jgi:hypothetical protein
VFGLHDTPVAFDGVKIWGDKEAARTAHIIPNPFAFMQEALSEISMFRLGEDLEDLSIGIAKFNRHVNNHSRRRHDKKDAFAEI